MAQRAIKKKVCMLGTLSVGKTSLVRRFVHSQFSERYKTTIGVKIDTRQVSVDDTQLNFVLWDMEGTDCFQALRESHLRGAAGYFLVVDGTRDKSLTDALTIRDQVRQILPDAPAQIVINKSDLRAQWCLDPARMESLAAEELPPIHTSARSGDNVEKMFDVLARRMLETHRETC